MPESNKDIKLPDLANLHPLIAARVLQVIGIKVADMSGYDVEFHSCNGHG